MTTTARIRVTFLALALASTAGAHAASTPLAEALRAAKTPIICAHRACFAPGQIENSLGAIASAADAGVRMVEVDLAASSDGVLHLLHDDDLDRTTTQTGSIATRTSRALATVTLRGSDEKLPTLRAALELARKRGLWLMLDVKRAPLATIVTELRGAHMLEQALVLTFDDATAESACASDDSLLVSVLVSTAADWERLSKRLPHPARLIAYVPQRAPETLWKFAHATIALTLTDVLGAIDQTAEASGPAEHARFVEMRRPTIVVTDHALRFANLTGSR